MTALDAKMQTVSPSKCDFNKHIFEHYREDLKQLVQDFSSRLNSLVCVFCDEKFDNLDRFSLHVGFEHSLINDIRETRGQAAIVLKQPEEIIEDQCEFCQKSFNNKVDLLTCYSKHFELELSKMCQELLEDVGTDLSCQFCSTEKQFLDQSSLAIHIGGMLYSLYFTFIVDLFFRGTYADK